MPHKPLSQGSPCFYSNSSGHLESSLASNENSPQVAQLQPPCTAVQSLFAVDYRQSVHLGLFSLFQNQLSAYSLSSTGLPRFLLLLSLRPFFLFPPSFSHSFSSVVSSYQYTSVLLTSYVAPNVSSSNEL